MTASRINASPAGDGGLMLKLGGEPEFSFFDDSSLYGVSESGVRERKS